MREEEVKKVVRESYSKIAKQGSSCCDPISSCGCSSSQESLSKHVGYTDEDLKAVPEGANLGLGCGNPVAIASLNEGETVLDLGSGAGFDCFLASQQVGSKGKVIGVDMTHEMIEKARENARKGAFENVEFRLGEIENLPVADSCIDVIISNCVINLSPNKERVFQEAFRILKPGGRLMVSDIVLVKELSEPVRNSVEAYVGCLAGAIMKDRYLAAIEIAGFQEVAVVEETTFPVELVMDDLIGPAISKGLSLSPAEIAEATGSISSIRVSGIKPL